MGTPWKTCGKLRSKALADKGFPQKKVLSLVLCVAVMLSVMVMGAGAAFSDQDKIENTEAVNMCTALNIIGGYEDGSYHPERNIERSEITKMICVALNGGKEPNLGTPVTPTFSDVRGSADAWAEKYIESCVAQGIVSGVGGGRFSPAGNVTGSQLAKMLLVCLGYDANIEGFTGNAWDTNVNVRASQKGLYEGLENMDVSAAITRDDAAQMMWNALNAYEIEYKTKIITDENGNLITVNEPVDKVVANTNDKITLLEDKYEATTATGILTDCEWVASKKEFNYTLAGETVTFPSATDYSDLFGMNVKVVYTKDNKTGDLKVYGIVEDDAKVITENVGGNIEDLKNITEGTTEKVKIDGVEYKLDKDITGYEFCNGKITSMTQFLKNYEDIWKAFTFKAIDNDNNDKIDTIVVYPFVVDQITFINNTKFATKTTYTTAKDLEDVTYYDGMAKDDWVMITSENNTTNDTAVLSKIDTVTGKIDGKRTNGTIDSIRVDGVWYEEIKDGVISQNNGSTVEMTVVNGYVFNCETSSESVATSDVVYLENAAIEEITSGLNTGKKLMGKIVKADGTIAEAEISTIDEFDVVFGSEDIGKGTSNRVLVRDTGENKNDAWTNADNAENRKVGINTLIGGLYSFSMDGNKYELTRLNDNNKGGFESYNESAVKYDKSEATLGDYNIADDSVIFVKAADEDDTKVYTGAQLKTWGDTTFTSSKVLTLKSSGGFETVSVAALTYGTLPVSGDTLYGYVTDDPYTTKVDGTTYYNYTVFVNGAEEEYISEDKGVDKGDMIAFNIKSDNEITVEDNFTLTNAAVLAATDTRVQLKDANKTDTYKITDDTVIVYIDTEDVIGSEGGSIAQAGDADSSNYYANVAYKLTNTATDKELAVLFVATNGQIADGVIIAH